MSTLNGAEDRDGEDSKHRPADHESCGARADPSIWCRGVVGAPGQGPLLVAKTPIRLPRTTDRVPDHAPGGHLLGRWTSSRFRPSRQHFVAHSWPKRRLEEWLNHAAPGDWAGKQVLQMRLFRGVRR